MQMKVRRGTYNQKHQASDQRNRIEVEVGGGVIRIEEVVAVEVSAFRPPAGAAWRRFRAPKRVLGAQKERPHPARFHARVEISGDFL